MQKILIVEDDRDIASIERDHPELNGYQVEIAPDGISGLARARSGEFDLVLLDLTLPGVDGFAVCRQLREETDIPILMVTARVNAHLFRYQRLTRGSRKPWVTTPPWPFT